MKYQIMLGILFCLLAKKRVSASELAARFECSTRSIYRYVEELSIAGIPVEVARGAGGGIYISDTYKLPAGFFTKEEYAAAQEAMLAMHAQTSDPTLLSAIQKLAARSSILVDSGTWGDERHFSERLTLFERAIKACEVLYIDYVDREGGRTRRYIHPHLLVYKQNIWYVYAYCLSRKAFRLFKLGRMRAVLETEEHFERRPFTQEDIPLSFWRTENEIEATFLIAPPALPLAEEWLGIDNVYERDGQFYADVTIPDDEGLVGRILSMGAGFKVLSPENLRQRVLEEARKIAEA